MYNIKNYMESTVINSIEDVLESNDQCKCDICINDIMAIALNALAPKYYVRESKGELFNKVDELKQQMHVDVMVAITNAAAKVAKNPKH